MLNKEFTLNLENFNYILNKYKNMQQDEREIFACYLAKFENVSTERIKVKSILCEKRLNGNVIIDYYVCDIVDTDDKA